MSKDETSVVECCSESVKHKTILFNYDRNCFQFIGDDDYEKYTIEYCPYCGTLLDMNLLHTQIFI